VAEGVARGRLHDPATGPRVGERAARLVAAERFRVEHILSGSLPAPVDYLQHEDEWVVLLTGTARLEVEGETIELTPGDWLFLPAGTAHRLLETAAGASWLAVYDRRRA
jgi:cupin 2 domain-containing protein